MWSPVVVNGEFAVHLNGDTSPELNNTLNLNSHALDFYESLVNDQFCFSGLCVTGTLTVNVTAGEFLSKEPLGWSLGNTSSAPQTYSPIHGVAVESGSAGSDILILLYGSITNNSWANIVGQLCYADDSSFTNTPSNDFIQIIGKRLLSPEQNSSTILFDPDHKYTIGAGA